MKTRRLRRFPIHRAGAVGLAIVSLVLALSLAGCSTQPTPQILVVTATFTVQTKVQVVTATFTPTAQGEPASPLPPAPGATALPPTPGATRLSLAKSSPSPAPSKTPVPSEVAAPTEPVVAPTEPSAPPTATAKPAARPVSLKSYFVVFTSHKGNEAQNYILYGMNGDGSDVFEIVTQASEPVFSPDGQKFAFYHWTDGLYIWDLNKQTSMRVVDNGEAAFATWSPNGQRLAYCNLYGQPQLYIVNADRSDNHPLTPGLRPSWSLKGGFIAYDSCENNRCGIFRINPDGGGKRQLTTDSGGGAAVSPDGSKIAYWSREDGDFEVYVVNADGSNRRQLTQNRGNDALPAWSPDGKAIYYLSDQNGKGWAVMVMNPDGSNPRKITGVNTSPDPTRGWQYQRIAVTWNE